MLFCHPQVGVMWSTGREVKIIITDKIIKHENKEIKLIGMHGKGKGFSLNDNSSLHVLKSGPCEETCVSFLRIETYMLRNALIETYVMKIIYSRLMKYRITSHLHFNLVMHFINILYFVI